MRTATRQPLASPAWGTVAAIEALASATFLIDHCGRMVYANLAGHRVLELDRRAVRTIIADLVERGAAVELRELGLRAVGLGVEASDRLAREVDAGRTWPLAARHAAVRALVAAGHASACVRERKTRA